MRDEAKGSMTEELCLHSQNVPAGSDTHPSSYSVNTGFVSGMKLPGPKADYWPSARAEHKSKWKYSPPTAQSCLCLKVVDRILTFRLAGVFIATGTPIVFLTASIFETTPFRLCNSQRSLVVWCLRTTGLHWMLLVFDSNWCTYTSKFKFTIVRKYYN